jgi:hypothetical protein
MRYLVAPDFSKKVVGSTPAVLNSVGSFLKLVEQSDRTSLVADKRVSSLYSEASDIFTCKLEEVWILFTFGSDSKGDYALMLDLILQTSPTDVASAQRPRLFAKRDPRTDSSVNPLINGQISPRFNGQLNPQLNGQINPRFNGQINPQFNGQINPRFNGQVNPRFNGQINPRFNSALNPAFNSAINPLRNTLMGGPFLYDLELNQKGFVVKANDKVSLVFDMSAQHTQTAVAHSQGFAVFDQNEDWTEYWVDTRKGLYLRFLSDGEWIGFVV